MREQELHGTLRARAEPGGQFEPAAAFGPGVVALPCPRDSGRAGDADALIDHCHPGRGAARSAAPQTRDPGDRAMTQVS